LPAAIALCTAAGAFAGETAFPFGSNVALPGGPVGAGVGVGSVLPGGGVPPVWAEAGTAAASANSAVSPASVSRLLFLSVFERKPISFVGLRG